MIFISYAQEDKSMVDGIYHALVKEYGSDKIYLDTAKSGFDFDYWLNIEKGLKKESSFFIFFNSRDYHKSVACGNELLIALDLQKKLKIIEIKIDSLPSHNAIERKMFYQHNTQDKTIKTIIDVINNQDYSAFTIESIIKEVQQKTDSEQGVLSLSFEVSDNIPNPIILCIYKGVKPNIEYSFSANAFLLGKEGNIGEFSNHFDYIMNTTLISGNKYEIKVNNWNEIKESFSLLIYNPKSNDETKLENYSSIFWNKIS